MAILAAPSGARCSVIPLERSVQLLPDLFFFSVIVTIVRLIRGDPAAGMLGTETTSEVMAQIRREMGLDQPGHRWPPGDLADPHALARQMVGDLVTRTPAG